MFTDERTLNVIHADLDCSVIYGTLRNCDLIPAFLNVIRDTPEYEQIMLSNSDYLNVITDPSADSNDERWQSEDMTYFLNEELFDVLDSYAPNGYYFGANIGDRSDFGYWKCEE